MQEALTFVANLYFSACELMCTYKARHLDQPVPHAVDEIVEK
jgi:hypothetical protein